MRLKLPVFKRGNKFLVAALNSLVEGIRPFLINPAGRAGWSQTPDGWQPPKTGSTNAGGRPPLTIVPNIEGEGITMTDGRVHVSSELGGLSEDAVPDINGTAINDEVPPVLALATGNNDIFCKIELIPASEPVPGSDPTEYRIGGYSTLVNLDVVKTTNGQPPTAQAPAINTSSGAVVQNLKASWHMGSAVKGLEDGEVTISVAKPQNRYGPINVSACGPAIAVAAPVYLILSDEVIEEDEEEAPE